MKLALLVDPSLKVEIGWIEACVRAVLKTRTEAEVEILNPLSHPVVDQWAQTFGASSMTIPDCDIPDHLLKWYQLHQICHRADIAIILSQYTGAYLRKSPLVYAGVRVLTTTQTPYYLFKIEQDN